MNFQKTKKLSTVNKKNTFNYDLSLYNFSGGGYTSTTFSTPSDGWNSIYGVADPYLDVTWQTNTVSNPVPTNFDRTTLSTYVANSTFDSLLSSYASSTNQATSTFATTIVTPNVCNSILTDCGTATTTLTSTGQVATTTLQTISTSTQVVDTTPTCNIINPYSYPYTLTGCTPTFMLPNGATTSDGTVKVYNTIAKNINTWITNSSNSQNDQVYIKYYPSSLYELDNRNVITINIPFNGKTIGTYRYSPGTTLPPEISFNSLNYQGSPVVITDTTGTSTQIIKQDAWGNQTTNSFIKDSVLPTEFGYTGHKYDMDSNLVYAHARYYDAMQRTWKSEDPMAINGFSSDAFLSNPQYQNSYSYSTQDPVNKLDPDGKFTILVPGTHYDPKEWSTTGSAASLYYAAAQQYGETPVIFNDKNLWSGGDNGMARAIAANNLTQMIHDHQFAPGEKLNIVAHSHGGNVVKTITWDPSIKIDNLVLIETPNRSDYTTNRKNVGNMIETYSNNDYVQSHGGSSIWNVFPQGILVNGEAGPASRYEFEDDALDLTNYTSKGSFIFGYQGIPAHSQPYTNKASLQTIFPSYNGYNYTNADYKMFMGVVNLNKK